MSGQGQHYQMHTGERLFVGIAAAIFLADHTFHGVFTADDGAVKKVKTTVRRGTSVYFTPAELERNGAPAETLQ